MGIEAALLSKILFVVSTAFQIAQSNKQKREADKRKGFNVTVSGTAAHIPVVYGKNSLGGIEVKHLVTDNFVAATSASSKDFQETFTNTSAGGSKNEYLHVQYALCQEGIEGVQWVKVNGQHYNSVEEKFKHFIRTFNDGGSADPVATANGVASTNKFTKTAFASSTFKLNRDDYNYNGIPQMEFLVKGRKVNWVKETAGVYSLSTGKVYSNNPALCLLDYLTNSDFGRGLPTSQLDLESFYHATDVCDTIVATSRTVGGKVNGQKTVNTVANNASRPTDLEKHTYENELWLTTDSGNYWYWNKTAWVQTTLTATRPIPLYECNIALDTEDKIRDNIERILSTMGMAELTWSSEGKYKLLLEYPTTVAEQNSLVGASHFFTDDDIIRDSISMAWPPASDRLSQATVGFLNEHEDFKEDSMTWPESFSATHNTYLNEDNGQPFQADFTVDGVSDPYHALAMAEQSVRMSRTMFTLSLTVSKKGLNLEPGDFVNITSTSVAITNEVFRVQSIEIVSDFTVKLTCYKFDFQNLAWNVADNIAYIDPPVFDFTVEPPTAFAYTPGATTTIGTSSGKLSWVFANDIAATEYLLEISGDNGATWENLGVTRANVFDVGGLVTGVYDFSIRSRSPVGTLSTRDTVENVTIQLLTLGRVAVIYANTANGATNTQSYTLGSNTYVAYYPYTSDLPILPIRSSIEFVLFVGPAGDDGDDGDDGVDGATGARGAGWWRYETGTSATTAGLSNSTIGAFFSTATGLAIVAGDRFIVVNTADLATGYLRNNANTSWIEQAEFIDGNLLVNGTVTADSLDVGAVTADKIAAGSIIASKLAAGSVTANSMAANSITAANGAIANLAVDTLQIKGGAITNRFASFNAGLLTLSSTYREVRSLNIDASGGPVSVLFNASFDDLARARVDIRLDGVSQREFDVSGGNYDELRSFGSFYTLDTIFYKTSQTVAMVINPSAGSRTVSVYVKTVGGRNVGPDISSRFLETTELKR
jgi:hypothetical protein